MVRKGAISKEQYGFLPKKSCVSQLLTVMKDWTDALSSKKCVDVIYFDFEKAFDRVNHSLLLDKLACYNFDPNVVAWIAHFLRDRICQVTVDGSFSDPFYPHSGVPQGSVLGPFLFLIFINDLPEIKFQIAKVKLFADDLKLYAPISSHSDAQNLQTDIDKVYHWAQENYLTLANDKIFLLRLGNKPIPWSYNLQKHIIDQVPCIRDLGILIDSNLSFDEHINDIVSKGSRRIFHLMNSLPRLTSNLYIQLYKAYVLPILEYGSVLFNPIQKGQIKRLEKPQKLFTKILAQRRLIPNTEYTGRLKALKMHTLEHRRTIIDLIHVYKILFGFIYIESNQFFSFPTRVNNRLSHGLRLNHPTKTPQNSRFLPSRIIPIWNNLPTCFKNIHQECKHAPQPPITTPEQFKNWLDSLPENVLCHNN